MSRLRGRFRLPTAPEMEQFASSVDIDLQMALEDVEASKAHAVMLGEVGILSDREAAALQRGLDEIAGELTDGSFRPTAAAEDIHMAVEARLEELLGEVAGKLHTARSRNDQVATDVRLWLKRRLVVLDGAIRELLVVLLDRIEKDGQILMPGYTHLQRGQPILLGHHLLGHAWPLSRDRQRLVELGRRVDASPLGACALAGTSHPIDRRRTAQLLGFASLVENAVDAVSARDHQQETAAVCAIAMNHFSRMAAELVLWSSAEFRFARLAEAFATGSSIMPQKRNPDAAELIRGKAGRVYGDLMTLLSLTQGLPLAYNRDLQEDRRALFDAVETATSSARILAGVWRSLELDPRRFEDELYGDDSLASELADALASRGVPFRRAWELVGRLLLDLERQGRRLRDLKQAELEALHPSASGLSLKELLDPRDAIARRRSVGSTAWPEVRRQVDLLRDQTSSAESPVG